MALQIESWTEAIRRSPADRFQRNSLEDILDAFHQRLAASAPSAPGVDWSRALDQSQCSNLQKMLVDLYQQQLDVYPDNGYLLEHAQPDHIRNQIMTFAWYFPYVWGKGTILDWGCRHAPDSCLIRACFGDHVEIHGYDLCAPNEFAVFHERAGLRFTSLDHPVRMPFADEMFDAVIASGVLEHVAMDYESLKELYRVLKPDGMLIVSSLPNRWSWEEWVRRVLRGRGYHQRRYGMRELRFMLQRTGFVPLEIGHPHYLLKQRRRQSQPAWRRWLAHGIHVVRPKYHFRSTHGLIAQKRLMM